MQYQKKGHLNKGFLASSNELRIDTYYQRGRTINKESSCNIFSCTAANKIQKFVFSEILRKEYRQKFWKFRKNVQKKIGGTQNKSKNFKKSTKFFPRCFKNFWFLETPNFFFITNSKFSKFLLVTPLFYENFDFSI